MALLSGTEKEWNERAQLSNYRCRDCREYIAFGDQELYFQQGLCTPCLAAREEERRTSSEPRKRLEQMRSRAAEAPAETDREKD